MPTTRELIAAYNALHEHRDQSEWAFPPTQTSLERISEILKIRLPDALIEFSTETGATGRWLASLGEDYTSFCHILKLNKFCRKLRRRKIGGHGQWEFVKPQNFIVFNRGFDQDYDCFDTSAYNAESGEYEIQYWSPPRIFGDTRYKSFNDYMESHIRSWSKYAVRDVKERVLQLLGSTD